MMRIGLDYAFLGEGLRECVRYGDVTRTVAPNEVSIGTGRTLRKPHDHARLKHEKCATKSRGFVEGITERCFVVVDAPVDPF